MGSLPWRVVISRDRAVDGAWCEANLPPRVTRDGGYQWRGPVPITGRLARLYDPWGRELWWFRHHEDAVLFDMVWG